MLEFFCSGFCCDMTGVFVFSGAAVRKWMAVLSGEEWNVRRIFGVLGVAALVLAAGCTSTGVDVTSADIDRLKPGVTTKQEVIQRFGQPTSTRALPGGGEVFYYTHTETSIKPYQVLPLVFVLTGGPDATVTAAELDFDDQALYMAHRLIRGKEAEALKQSEQAAQDEKAQAVPQ